MTARTVVRPQLTAELPDDAETVISYGMGVDSSACITELILNPERRSWRLDKLTVLIAIVGATDEYRDIRHQVENYVFPLLADAGVRTVQVARNGPRAADGYSVLSDTRAPKRLVPERATWALSTKMLEAGTVPQVNPKKRTCSEHAKHWALKRWIRDNIKGRHRHILGFSSEEQDRIDLDLGFATDQRHPVHPLADWQWTREVSQIYLETVYGERFVRSCCSFCPFQYNTNNLLTLAQRWTDEPEAGATALEMEYVAVRLNEKAYLFGDKSALKFARDHHLDGALSALNARLEESAWAVYDVGRVLHADTNNPAARGHTWRSVTTLQRGGRRQMEGALHGWARQCRAPIEYDANGFERVALSRRGEGYPATERYLVAGPARAIDKRRAKYYEAWDAVHPLVGIDLGDVARYPQRRIEAAEAPEGRRLCQIS